MNALYELTNSDKAKLLHRLFPQHIAGLLDFIGGMAETVQEEKDKGRKVWDNEWVSFDDWLAVAADVGKRIERNSLRMTKQPELFASFLFNGYTSLFTIHCLVTYIAVSKHPDNKFSKAVDLFFNP